MLICVSCEIPEQITDYLYFKDPYEVETSEVDSYYTRLTSEGIASTTDLEKRINAHDYDYNEHTPSGRQRTH